MMNARNACLPPLVLLLAACGGETGEATDAAEPDPIDSIAVAPALVPPSESADPSQPQSYEVAIAAAAANRNKALARCAKQPEIVRPQCEQEANTAFSETQSSLQDLRGNQQ